MEGERGIYRRVNPRTGKLSPLLWIAYPGPRGRTIREPAHTADIRKARRLRGTRLEQHRRGEPGRAAEPVRVDDVFDAYLTNRQVNGKDVSTVLCHLKALRPAVGHLKAIEFTTDIIEQVQLAWQQKGTSNAVINRRCGTLRCALNLARRAGKLHVVPYIMRLDEPSHRARYLSPTDAMTLDEHLPPYLRLVFDFAYEHGTRRGQLTRTLRRFVDLERGLIVWPPDECKAKEPHTLPLEGRSLELVASLMKRPPLWCPYLFHGPRCAPGRIPSARWGCVGDWKRAWGTALKGAGLPAGRKAGGYVFHCTRNAAATNLRSGGMDEANCMKITGHQTSHVFRHYDLGNVDALRQRLAQARTKVATPLHSVAR